MEVIMNLASEGASWWDLVPALLGAIVGSATGAIPVFILARRSANELLARDATARKEAAKAAMIRLSVKLLTINDEIGNLREYVRHWLGTKDQPGREKMEPFQLVPPMMGPSDQDIVTLEAEELAVLFGGGHYELMQKLMLLQRRAASINVSFRAYCIRREAWKDIAPTPEDFQGSLGRARITKEQELKLKMHTVPLNDLIISISKHLEEDWRLLNEVTKEFTKAARPILEMPGFTIASTADGLSASSS